MRTHRMAVRAEAQLFAQPQRVMGTPQPINNRERQAMLNGRQLRQKFIEFNAQYFGNKLPAYAIRVVERIPDFGRGFVTPTARCNRKRRRIEILRGLPDEESIGTLLHEMAHAATTEDHDLRWRREMIRLREAGAPLTEEDLTISLDAYRPRPLTKAMFRRCVEAAFRRGSIQTWSDAVRYFGDTATVAGFRKKHRWADAVFRRAKKEFALPEAAREAKAKLAGGG
jgi:hypothetical protein